jgi:hypothetical protein
MKNFTKAIVLLFALAIACVTAMESAAATKYDATLNRWSKSDETRDDMGGTFRIRATLYTAEYIEALMQSEAEKNLWTSSELEDYKYNFLKGLSLDDNIAIHLELEEQGPTAHMAPFDEMIVLWIGRTKYSPTEYDPRFNMPLQGKRDGMVFFPRYNDKTGAPLLAKDVTLRLVVNGAVSPVLENKEIRFVWDVKAENIADSIPGTAADRLEVDRLLRRMELLTAERRELESALEAKNREIDEISARIDELQRN